MSVPTPKSLEGHAAPSHRLCALRPAKFPTSRPTKKPGAHENKQENPKP